MGIGNYHGSLLGWSLLLIVVGTLAGCGQPTHHNQTSDAYRFPVQPGSPQWLKLYTRQQMLAAVQIPPDRLAHMSTPGLVATVLDYPLFMDLFAHSGMQQGLDAMRRDFNGIAALMERPDAGTHLLQAYRDRDATTIARNTLSEEQETATVYQLYYLEALLSQQEILAQLSHDESVALLQLTLAQREARQHFPEVYGVASIESTARIAGGILLLNGALSTSDAHIETFLREGLTVNDREAQHTYQDIFERAERFLD